jgi:hypothetical protein
VHLVALRQGWSTDVEAAEHISGLTLKRLDGEARKAEPRPRAVTPAAAPAAVREDAPRKKVGWGEQVLREATPILGTGAQAYLENRGVRRERLWWDLFASPNLLFHPAAPHRWDGDGRRWITWPAMIGRVQAPDGYTGGLHVTYLAKYKSKGWAKAPVDPPKRMWGEMKDELGRPGGVWLIGPEGNEPAIAAEGIESALSAAILHGKPCRVLATLSLKALQGVWRTDKWGRLNPDLVEADPDVPALTWPFGQSELILAVDHDMKPIKVKCRKATGGTYERVLTATERARICAGLAEQAWRKAGWNPVRTMAAGVGRDFNDELLSRLGR